VSRRAIGAARLAGVALVLGATSGTRLAAQEAAPRQLSLWIGAGGAVPLSQPGVDRQAGASALAALELPVTARLGLRVEASAAAQDLDTRADGPLSGDLQQVRATVAARFAPVSMGRVTPYALAGGGLFWQSSRIVLRELSNPVPDAEYRETSSRSAAGVLAGVGATASVARVRLFGEARWTRVGADAGATTDLAILAGVTLPLGW
jgi:hypothetical protein